MPANSDVWPPIGHVVSVTGAQALIALPESQDDASASLPPLPTVGKILKIRTDSSRVFALVSAATQPSPEGAELGTPARLLEVDLLGEIVDDIGEGLSFRRGVANYPSIGDAAYRLSRDELALAYRLDGAECITIGTLLQEPTIPASVGIDDLLGKHFAVLGSTGAGKSCGVALILNEILESTSSLRIFLIDPHNEYRRCFGNRAETVSPGDINLPFWLFNFEEITDVFFRGRPGIDDEVEVLREVIPIAKQRYAANQGRARRRRVDSSVAYTVDTPVPYRVSDLIALLEERIGKLENRSELAKYRRLKARIEAVSRDPRCSFMFGQLTVEDTMVDVLSRLFRVPINDKPITIMELAGFPSDVVDAVVSVLCRMAFDLGQWGDGFAPILVVCEEAHRYVPASAEKGFGPTRRAISLIAKEGRKYGVYLGIVSQRPVELDMTILSQCSTIFAMRMLNDRDQEIVRAAVSDAASSLLDFLPSMGEREATAFGEGVSLPMRLRFSNLPAHLVPNRSSAQIGPLSSRKAPDLAVIDKAVSRWRAAATHVIEGGGDTMAAESDYPGGSPPPSGSDPWPGPTAAEPQTTPMPDVNPARRVTDPKPEAGGSGVDWQALREQARKLASGDGTG